MSIPSNIDTQAIVGKYLSRQTTGVRLNADSNTADENQAVLESIAIAFLLNPQAVLSIILRAKNSLQQLIQADIDIIDYVTAAIAETRNPDAVPESTADLVDAQTALVELDRLGRIDTNLQAFTRYQNSINNFLNNELAPLLKRSPNGTFNRAGLEAKQDLFNAVGLFTQTHQLLADRLKTLAASVSNFNGVDLSRVVHTQTITRVRTSLSQIKVGMDNGEMSNTVAALELLAGTAALQSISNTRGVYDDTVSIEDGYTTGPEPTAAFADSDVGPLFTAQPTWNLSLAVDGAGSLTHELPKTGKSNCPFLVNSIQGGTFIIPVGVRLYVEVTPGATPDPNSGTTLYSIPLTSGVRTVSQVIIDINAVFGGAGPVASDFDTPAGYIMLIAAATDTSIRVLGAGPGSFNIGTGIFTPSPASAHTILGYANNQVSNPVGFIDFPFLKLFFGAEFPGTSAEILNTGSGPLRISSNNTTPATSSLQFAGLVASDFGFPTGLVHAIPQAMLVHGSASVVVEPTGLGLLEGSIIHSAAFIQPVVGFDGNRILFDPSLVLPLSYRPLRVVAPTVAAVQVVMAISGRLVNSLDGDILPLQGLLSPLLTTPSLAQVSDAQRSFSSIRARLVSMQGELSAVVVAEAQQPADATAESVIHTLEERGFDYALDLLSQCKFSDFFGVTSETVSKSTRFMKSMETVVSTDLQTSTIEEQMPDGNLLAGVNPSSVLTNKEVP